MNRVLLTGAGFSRNWGGWLADEITCQLLDAINKAPQTLIAAEFYMQLEGGGNYETILQEFQRVYADDPHSKPKQEFVAIIEAAIIECFFEMDRLYEGKIAGINNDAQYNAEVFLAHFDSIFTTNQDLLIERHFQNLFNSLAIKRTDKPDRNGVVLPGAVGAPAIFYKPIKDFRQLVMSVPDEAIDVSNLSKGYLPYIKLHGSYNWQTVKGNRLMISGGNKNKQITQSPLLKSYFDYFSEIIKIPNTYIVAVGYGFNDDHINTALLEAFKHGARLYIIDPRGVKTIQHCFVTEEVPADAKEREQYFKGREFKQGLIASLQGKLFGLSQRTLNEIFLDSNQTKLLFHKLFNDRIN